MATQSYTMQSSGERVFRFPHGGRLKLSGTLKGGATWSGGQESRLLVVRGGITEYQKTAKGFVRYRIFPPKQEIHEKKQAVSFELKAQPGDSVKVLLHQPTARSSVKVTAEIAEPPPPPPPPPPPSPEFEAAARTGDGDIMATTAALTTSGGGAIPVWGWGVLGVLVLAGGAVALRGRF